MRSSKKKKSGGASSDGKQVGLLSLKKNKERKGLNV
jgi:hypothetical protein